jgi:hypothetical protein
MEHLYVTYPDAASRDIWLNETQVSFVAISTYLGSEKSPNRGTLHRYEGSIVQMIDSETSYGKLLTQQSHRGKFKSGENEGAVVERNVHFILNVDRPGKDETRLFTRQGLIPPSWIMLDILIPLEVMNNYHEMSINDQLKEASLADDLSDLEVDRIFEISGDIAAWISNPLFLIAQRKREKQKLEVALNELHLAIEPLRENLEIKERALGLSIGESEKLSIEIQDKRNESNTQLAERIDHVQKERAMIPARQREINSEISDLQKRLEDELPIKQRAYEEARTSFESVIPAKQVMAENVAALKNDLDDLIRNELTIRSRLFYYR